MARLWNETNVYGFGINSETEKLVIHTLSPLLHLTILQCLLKKAPKESSSYIYKSMLFNNLTL